MLINRLNSYLKNNIISSTEGKHERVLFNITEYHQCKNTRCRGPSFHRIRCTLCHNFKVDIKLSAQEITTIDQRYLKYNCYSNLLIFAFGRVISNFTFSNFYLKTKC